MLQPRAIVRGHERLICASAREVAAGSPPCRRAGIDRGQRMTQDHTFIGTRLLQPGQRNIQIRIGDEGPLDQRIELWIVEYGPPRGQIDLRRVRRPRCRRADCAVNAAGRSGAGVR